MSTEKDSQAGNALVEFVFVAVLVLVPLIYLIVGVAEIQHSRLAVSNAARDVGRALATGRGNDSATADRVAAALRIALANQGLSPADVQLRLVPVSASCGGAPIESPLDPGSEYAVCVVRRLPLPGVPGFVSGRGVTIVGRYVVHNDDFHRAATP